MIYQSLKNMTEEEKLIHKKKQRAKAQRKYYQSHKDYYKNYSTKYARQEKENLKNKINELNKMNENQEIMLRKIYNIIRDEHLTEKQKVNKALDILMGDKVMPLKELESYEPKNIIEEEYNTNCELPQSDYSSSLFNKKMEKMKNEIRANI